MDVDLLIPAVFLVVYLAMILGEIQGLALDRTGMPLKNLACDFQPERDSDLLRSLKTLEFINIKTAAQFWKDPK